MGGYGGEFQEILDFFGKFWKILEKTVSHPFTFLGKYVILKLTTGEMMKIEEIRRCCRRFYLDLTGATCKKVKSSSIVLGRPNPSNLFRIF